MIKIKGYLEHTHLVLTGINNACLTIKCHNLILYRELLQIIIYYIDDGLLCVRLQIPYIAGPLKGYPVLWETGQHIAHLRRLIRARSRIRQG